METIENLAEPQKKADKNTSSTGLDWAEEISVPGQGMGMSPHPREDKFAYGGHHSFLERHPFVCGYSFLGLTVILLFATRFSAFSISFLFLYLISDFLTNDMRRVFRWIPKALLFSVMYVLVISVITVMTYKVIPDFIKQLPGYANQVETEVIKNFEYLTSRYSLSDYIDPPQVQSAIVDGTTEVIGVLVGKFRGFYQGFIYFIFALVINLLLYHNLEKVDLVFQRRPGSLMSFLYGFTLARLRMFYFYFKRVMGGQIIISAINASITTIVIIALGLPHKLSLIVLVYLFGLLPIVGNLISNTILTLTALISVGLWGAAACLVYLVCIHKFEYFLNSKIIGDIVKLPMVITLTALIVCQVLLGIIGMILAIPLVLYLRHELEVMPGLPGFEAGKMAPKDQRVQP